MESQICSRAPGTLEVAEITTDLFAFATGWAQSLVFLLCHRYLFFHPGDHRHMSYRCGYDDICKPNEQVVWRLSMQVPSVFLPLTMFVFAFLSVGGDFTSPTGRLDMVDLRAKNTATNSFLRTAL